MLSSNHSLPAQFRKYNIQQSRNNKLYAQCTLQDSSGQIGIHRLDESLTAEATDQSDLNQSIIHQDTTPHVQYPPKVNYFTNIQGRP